MYEIFCPPAYVSLIRIRNMSILLVFVTKGSAWNCNALHHVAVPFAWYERQTYPQIQQQNFIWFWESYFHLQSSAHLGDMIYGVCNK